MTDPLIPRLPDVSCLEGPCVCGHDIVDHSRVMKQCSECAECREFRCRACAAVERRRRKRDGGRLVQWYGKLGNASGANETVVPMPDPLSPAQIARMKAEHVDSLMVRHCDQHCVCMNVTTESCYPCDAALLVKELERMRDVERLSGRW